jgi:hypothetical protein
MAGRDFLEVARKVVLEKTPYFWRAAAIHAYYALMLECRDALDRWGFVKPRRDSVHPWVRLCFQYATDTDIKKIGNALDDLVRLRNEASYELVASISFRNSTKAADAIQKAAAALALLDAIEADPARRAIAVASIRP